MFFHLKQFLIFYSYYDFFFLKIIIEIKILKNDELYNFILRKKMLKSSSKLYQSLASIT